MGTISLVASIVGVIFYFINPTVTIICGIISVINSVYQCCKGVQNNINTELAAVALGLLGAIIFKVSIFATICFALCVAESVLMIAGTLLMFIFFKKR